MEQPIQTDLEVAERFAQIVADSLRIENSRVTMDTYLDDLGAESLDLIEITMESEAKFHVWIPEKSILDTAIEVCGPGVLEQDGYLTDEGRRLMMHRLPEAERSTLPQRLSVQDLRRSFLQVGSWVRMIAELKKYTPTTCPECAGSMAPTPGLQMKCAGCGQEVALRSGEALNREWVLQHYSPAPVVRVDACGAGESVCLG